MISMEPVLKRGYAAWDRTVLTEDEYALRAAAVRAALREEGYDALVVVNYSLLGVMVDYADIAYLSGLQSGGALVLAREGEPKFVSFGGGRELAFMRQLTPLAIAPGAGKAFDVVRSELAAQGVTAGRLATVGAQSLPAPVAERFAAALSGYELGAFDARLAALRAVKRPRELLAARLALGIVEQAVAAGAAAFSAGADNRTAMLEAERVARTKKARDVRVLASMGGPELRPWEGRLDGRHVPLKLWVAAQYQGYWAEAAATTPTPPPDHPARTALRAMRSALRAGGTAGEVAAVGVAALPAAAVDSALAYGLGGAIGLARNEGCLIRRRSAERFVEGALVALRVHVSEGEPALVAGVFLVGKDGATALVPQQLGE